MQRMCPKLAAIVVLVVLLLSIVGCNRAEQEASISFGAVLPLTGSAAAMGKYCQQGIDLAITDLNSTHTNKPIRIIYEDSKAEPKTAVTAAEKLISIDKVPAILCLTTGDTSAMAPMCEKSKVILLTSTVAPGAADLGEYVFRNASNLQKDAEKMAVMCVSHLGKKRVAVMALNVDALRTVAETFKKNIESLGGTVVATEFGEKGGTDFRAQLTKIKNATPEAIYFGGYIETAYMMKQAREIGIDAQFLADPAFESPKSVEVAGNAAEGVIFTRAAFDTTSEEKTTARFVQDYKRRYGVEPEVFAAQAYDCVRLLAEATKQTGTTSETIRSFLLTVKDYDGASGKTTFLPNGDVEKPILFRTVIDGKFKAYDVAQ